VDGPRSYLEAGEGESKRAYAPGYLVNCNIPDNVKTLARNYPKSRRSLRRLSLIRRRASSWSPGWDWVQIHVSCHPLEFFSTCSYSLECDRSLWNGWKSSFSWRTPWFRSIPWVQTRPCIFRIV